MKNSLLLTLALCVLAVPPYTTAQTASSEGAPPTAGSLRTEAGVPIERIIATVAKKTGKKFVLDPRVHANAVLVGQDPSEITYPQFLTVLEVYGYAAVDEAGYVQIVPDAMIRQEAIPTITSKETRPAAEYVTQIIPLKYISAPQLVPILRPMMPQQGHLAAMVSANSLIIVDRFANVRRIEVRSLDTLENKPRDVETKKEP
jgi:type II secretory pathway component GspD/PulD (secretin)